MTNNMEYINPDGLIKSHAFSQVITTQGTGKTIYIGGQNAIDKDEEVIGKGNILLQTEQVMKNLEIALKASGAGFDNLVKLGIYLVQGQDAYGAFQVSQRFLKHTPNPPTISVLFVAGLANPDFLLEIDAIAFVPEQ
ncbi:MAG: RidA family protein [Cytophagales bacterium]|nr:RidA family protein [Cytophagales bacterium]